jgi:hypothetical protein
MHRIPVTPEPQTVWVLVFKYDDDPLPGLIVGSSPESVVNAWLADEMGGINMDAQGFPENDEDRDAMREVHNYGQHLLAQQAQYKRTNRTPRVDCFGQDISLHERTLDV